MCMKLVYSCTVKIHVCIQTWDVFSVYPICIAYAQVRHLQHRSHSLSECMCGRKCSAQTTQQILYFHSQALAYLHDISINPNFHSQHIQIYMYACTHAAKWWKCLLLLLFGTLNVLCAERIARVRISSQS